MDFQIKHITFKLNQHLIGILNSLIVLPAKYTKLNVPTNKKAGFTVHCMTKFQFYLPCVSRWAGCIEEGSSGEREGGIPDHRRPRDQDSPSTEPPLHHQPETDRHGQAGRSWLPQRQRWGFGEIVFVKLYWLTHLIILMPAPVSSVGVGGSYL